MKLQHYRLVTSEYVGNFEKQVNELTKEGYELHGETNIFCTKDGGNTRIKYHQALKKTIFSNNPMGG